jgi:hemerythrin
MPFAEWGDNCDLGIEAFDRDHKRLLALLNKLHNAVEAGHAQEVLARVLAALNIYVNFHFTEEEELFLRTNYPGYETHRREHREMAAAVEEIRRDFEKSASDALPQRVLEFLKGWLYDHHMRFDRAFAEYLEANRATLELQDNSASARAAQ